LSIIIEEARVRMKNPPHPGRLVRSELDELGVSVADAARALGVTRQQLYNVINGKSGVRPEMAIRLAKGIGGSADAWLRMQQAYDLAQIADDEISVTKIAPQAA
jgi:addiction module HigA family antidote